MCRIGNKSAINPITSDIDDWNLTAADGLQQPLLNTEVPDDGCHGDIKKQTGVTTWKHTITGKKSTILKHVHKNIISIMNSLILITFSLLYCLVQWVSCIRPLVLYFFRAFTFLFPKRCVCVHPSRRAAVFQAGVNNTCYLALSCSGQWDLINHAVTAPPPRYQI